MKRKPMMTAMLPALVVAVLSWPGNAGPSSHAGEQGAVSDGDILDALKSMGLRPTGQPVRRGDHYVLHAIDPSGAELRVVGDATFGDILSIAPARPVSIYASAPAYGAGPRIIHVPQPGERTSLNTDNDDVEASVEPDRIEQMAPPPRRHATKPRRPFERSPAGTPRRRAALAPAMPPAPPVQTGPTRPLLNAPPLPTEGPTPIKPTPRWRNSIDTTGQIPPQAQAPAVAPSVAPDAAAAPDTLSPPTVLPEDPPAAD